MLRIFALLFFSLLIFGSAGLDRQTTLLQASPITGTTTKLMRVGDTYVVTVPGVSWALRFPAGELEPSISDDRQGYYYLRHKSIARFFTKAPKKEDAKKALNEMMADIKDKLPHVSFWVDYAGKCNNDARTCRDMYWEGIKKAYPQLQKAKLWQSGKIYFSEHSMVVVETMENHDMHAHFIFDSRWLHFHLSKFPYEQKDHQLFIDFLNSIRFMPIAEASESATSPKAIEMAKLSAARKVVPGVDDRITIHAMSVRLPSGEGWQRKDIPMPAGGLLLEFERSLAGGNRLQIHIADYYGPAACASYEFAMINRNDPDRLARFLEDFQKGLAAMPQREVRRSSEWVDTVRLPQQRFGAVCRELHQVREASEAKPGA